MTKPEYENNDPISDDLVVLDLLYNDRWEYKIERRLHLPHPNWRTEPYVRVIRSEFTVLDFRIAAGVGERLLACGLVEGKKHWGYTDDRDLSISDYGRATMRETYEKVGIKYDDHFTQRPRTERWIAESKTCSS